jgi:hypothetical protein
VKRKTFYYISLSLPYLALILCGGLLFFAYELGIDFPQLGGLPGFFFGMVAVFAASAFIWGPLYTWMVLAVLFWSRGKTANEIRSMYLFSPILLGCSMGIPAVFVDLRSSAILLIGGILRAINLDFILRSLIEENAIQEAIFIGVVWALMAATCLIVGYAFVGIALLIEKMMKQRGMFGAEES